MVTVAETDIALFALMVAVITDVVLLLTQGAVNNPLLEIVPTVAFHVTPVLLVLLTMAVNRHVAAEIRLADSGVREIVIAELPIAAALPGKKTNIKNRVNSENRMIRVRLIESKRWHRVQVWGKPRNIMMKASNGMITLPV